MTLENFNKLDPDFFEGMSGEQKKISLNGAINGEVGPCLPENELEPLVLYYRPIEHRGHDQWICWDAMKKQKEETGRIRGFCSKCIYYVPMTSLDSNTRFSEDCGKGHYRFEAT